MGGIGRIQIEVRCRFQIEPDTMKVSRQTAHMGCQKWKIGVTTDDGIQLCRGCKMFSLSAKMNIRPGECIQDNRTGFLFPGCCILNHDEHLFCINGRKVKTLGEGGELEAGNAPIEHPLCLIGKMTHQGMQGRQRSQPGERGCNGKVTFIFTPYLFRGCRGQQDAAVNVVFPRRFIKNPGFRSVFDGCTQLQFLDECRS